MYGRPSGEALSSPPMDSVLAGWPVMGDRGHTRSFEPAFGWNVAKQVSEVPLTTVARVRLDTLLAERGLFASRTRAAASVMAGEVRVGGNGERAQKPGQLVDPDIVVAVDEAPRFVSRGGIKLANALERFAIDVRGRRCLDAGASTGGVVARARRRRTRLPARSCPRAGACHDAPPGHDGVPSRGAGRPR